MTEIWLAEKNSRDREVLGVFSGQERAKDVCRESAESYFGPERTRPLAWQDGSGYSSASYTDPSFSGLFQVTRYVVDEVRFL